MLARHNGRVVLVSGAIPGERVSARLERTERGVAFAGGTEVLQPSADRRPTVAMRVRRKRFRAHRARDNSRSKARSSRTRSAHRPAPAEDPPLVTGSPERGYRMRARLHVAADRSASISKAPTRCVTSRQPVSCCRKPRLDCGAATHTRREALRDIAAIEIAENIPGQERACHLELHAERGAFQIRGDCRRTRGTLG